MFLVLLHPPVFFFNMQELTLAGWEARPSTGWWVAERPLDTEQQTKAVPRYLAGQSL